MEIKRVRWRAYMSPASWTTPGGGGGRKAMTAKKSGNDGNLTNRLLMTVADS